MAQLSGTQSTYDVNPPPGGGPASGVGTGVNREDLSDEMQDVSPTETPVVSMIGRRTAKNTQFDWPKDQLAAAGNSAVQEGNETTRSAPTPPTRARNVTQINEKVATVSGTQEAMDSAGVAKMMAYQKAKKLKELKLDIEQRTLVYTGTAGAAAGGGLSFGTDAAPLRYTRSLPHFLTSNLVAANTSWAAPVDEVTSPVPGAGPNVAFTEDHVTAAQKLAYDNGGMPTKLIVSTSQKIVASDFVGRTNSRQNIGKTEVNLNVTLFAGPFGVLEIVPDRYMTNLFVLGVDPEYAAIAYLRKPGSFRLGKQGDAETEVVNAEWGVEVGTERAHFIIAGLTAT